jgi:phage baseplate assembly protein W
VDELELTPEEKLEEYKNLQTYSYRDYSAKLNDDKLVGLNNSFDVEAVKNALINLFVINKGEVPGKPSFGNAIQLMLFDSIDDFTKAIIEDNIRVEIELYEPRVFIESVDINIFEEFHRIIVDIIFRGIIDDVKIYETLYLPFSSNDYSYLGGRSLNTI